jgi:hypothetical protein
MKLRISRNEFGREKEREGGLKDSRGKFINKKNWLRPPKFNCYSRVTIQVLLHGKLYRSQIFF